MLIIEKIKATAKPEKPKYGKAIALTVIGVAAVEAAAFLALTVIKKIKDSKIDKQAYDEDFEIGAQTEECRVEFEKTNGDTADGE